MLRPILWILLSIFIQAEAHAKINSSVPKETPQFSDSLPIAEKNLHLGKTFLEENQKKADIHSLPSGMQYKVQKEGEGQSPGPTDVVTVNYRGTLIDGTEFDSSYSRHTPATFAVNAVIPGWTEALQLMKPGAKWTVYIPSKLAYGEYGAGRLIGPNSTLIFDIELLSVKSSLDLSQEGLSDEIDDEG